MPITAGEIRAQMTLDASGFSEGMARAQTSLSTLTAAGERVSNAVADAESRITSSASAIADAMQQAGSGSNQLSQLAARADQAGARVDILGQRAAGAAQKLSEAMRAAQESGDALTQLQDSAAASAENLAAAQRELDALQASGTATADEIAQASAAVEEFSAESAELDAQVNALRATHEANNAAVAEAEAKYRQLQAQLNGAQASAALASDKFAALTGTLGGLDADGAGLSGITATLSQLGTSTMIRASRSLGTIATNAMGLSSSSVVGVLASRTMSTTLATLVRTLGLARFGMIGAGAAALYFGYQLIKANQNVEDSTDRWARLYETVNSTSQVDFKAIANADIELETTGLEGKVQSVYQQIGEALTDGKPDTEAVISEIQGSAQQMFADVRQRIQTWYDTEMAGLDLSTSSGLQKARALTEEYNGLMDRVDALDDNTAAFIASYAGKSTEECKNALSQLETYEQELERLAKRADEQAALATSNQHAAYTTATNGLTTDQTTVANATQYVKFRYAMQLDDAQEDYEAQVSALWQEYQSRLQSAADDQERAEINAEYEIKLQEANDSWTVAQTQLRNEYKQGLSAIMQGVAEAAMRSDPQLAEAIQKAVNGDFEKLGELNLDNSALVAAIKSMVEAGLFEGFTDADLTTTEGQMQQLVNMLAYGLNDVQSAWQRFGMSERVWLGTIDVEGPNEAAAYLREWAAGIRSAIEDGDPEAVRDYVRRMTDAMNPQGAEWINGDSYIDRAAQWIYALNDAVQSVNVNPAMLATQTDALSDLLTVVRQMDAADPRDYAFLDSLAQSLAASGLATDAGHVADALEGVLRAAGGAPAEIAVPADVTVEPNAVSLPDPEALGFEPQTVSVTVEPEFAVDMTGTPRPEEIIEQNHLAQLEKNAIPLTLPAEVTLDVQSAGLPEGFEWSSVLPDPEEIDDGAFGDSLSRAVEEGMLRARDSADSSSKAIADAAAGGLDGLPGEFSGAGDNAGGAFVSALRGHIGSAAAAATAIGSAAYNALKASLDIHSPSRKMRKLGAYTGEGYALGIDDRVLLAERSMQRLAGGAMTGAAAGATHNDQRSWTNNINNPTVRSEEDVRRLSRRMARLTADTTYGVT